MTGSMPGIAASTSETWLFGSPPNSVEAPENSFEFEVTWAWTSRPITTSQSPVAPLISLPLHSCLVTPEQRRHHPLPFGFQRTGRDRLAGPPVPIAGIAEIALDAVQIGMDPGGIGVVFVLNDLVRLRPIGPWRPTTARPAARSDPAQARRQTGWL